MKTRYSRNLLTVALVLTVVSLLLSGQAFAQVTGRDIASDTLQYEGHRVVYDSAASVQYTYKKFGIQLHGT
ncbi:MAG: hypothetical protein NUK65_02375, partial [Firmicutes bacterium]|nr:hypothetical protein [Bacillota bacterium]